MVVCVLTGVARTHAPQHVHERSQRFLVEWNQSLQRLLRGPKQPRDRWQ